VETNTAPGAQKSVAVRAAPAVFVLLWSTGFVAARYATEDNGAMAFLTTRMVVAGGLLFITARLLGAPRLTRTQLMSSVIAGVGINALYLGGVFVAIAAGMSSSLSSLIAGLHPVATAILAFLLFSERLRSRQWIGVGLGLAGVAWFTIDSAQGASLPVISLVAMAVSLAGMVSGTLVQRRWNAQVPLLGGTAAQYGASAILLGLAAIFVERRAVVVTPTFVFALIYAVVVLSVGAVLIMLWLLRNGGAAQVSSLFFLTPTFSALEAAVLFGEPLTLVVVLSLALSAVGVVLVMRTPNN